LREIISAIIIAISLAGGTAAVKSLHDQIRQAALEKASKGLPSLSQMTRAMREKKKEFRKSE
jgi:hypothetical protein